MFYAFIENKELQGHLQIRLDPGTVLGEYWLESIEIRAVQKEEKK